MPLVVLAGALVIVGLTFVALMPLSLVPRYRAGTARQLARGWLAVAKVLGFTLSAGLLLLIAAVTSAWVPNAFSSTCIGLAGGALLGMLGLMLTRWESTPWSRHYTPNRWLVLAITLVVTSRMAYGLWRSWHAWRAAADNTSWLASSGAAVSLAAGAVVLGYYLMYWTGLWRRMKQ